MASKWNLKFDFESMKDATRQMRDFERRQIRRWYHERDCCDRLPQKGAYPLGFDGGCRQRLGDKLAEAFMDFESAIGAETMGPELKFTH